ncbi:MAG: hypothetical protein ACYC1G_14580 [Thiobacillus sp.]
MTESEMSALDEKDLRHRFERGDFHGSSDSLLAQQLLHAFDRENEFIKKCERAAVSQALDAKTSATRANTIAIIALVMATISTICSVIVLLL